MSMLKNLIGKPLEVEENLLGQPSLDVLFAEELLNNKFKPIDELIEGLLTIGGGSILYGDSNSGKTFLAIDLACAIARGIKWMGRRTHQGLVVYLATESPGSVITRLYAYQKYHDTIVPNFVVIKSPVNLFNGDNDTNVVIYTIQQLEQQQGEKVQLIIGDTLARLSAGANENAGQDMSLVMRRFDRIRNKTGAHFMLIHHCGKNTSNGARGWSGLRAAIDTEIEVTSNSDGRYIEVTKQRDLPSKGERISFALTPVKLDIANKWGKNLSTCVVEPVIASRQTKLVNKRLSW